MMLTGSCMVKAQFFRALTMYAWVEGSSWLGAPNFIRVFRVSNSFINEADLPRDS